MLCVVCTVTQMVCQLVLWFFVGIFCRMFMCLIIIACWGNSQGDKAHYHAKGHDESVRRGKEVQSRNGPGVGNMVIQSAIHGIIYSPLPKCERPALGNVPHNCTQWDNYKPDTTNDHHCRDIVKVTVGKQNDIVNVPIDSANDEQKPHYGYNRSTCKGDFRHLCCLLKMKVNKGGAYSKRYHTRPVAALTP